MTSNIKSLLDPTKPQVASLSDKTDELDRMAQTNAVMAFDNLSSLSNKMSDHWCKLATGNGVRIKKFYVTNEYITFEAIRPIIANGISQTLVQSYVLNRAIPIELVPLKNRVDDTDFRQHFQEAKPKLLGALFSLLSKAMRIYPEVPARQWPRMGSFAKWGWATAEALDGCSGDNFIAALNKVAEFQHDEVLYSNPLAQALILFMRHKGEWKSTVTKLLQGLEKGENDELESITLYDIQNEIQGCIKSPY